MRATGSASARAGSRATCRPSWSTRAGRCICCARPAPLGFLGFVFFIGGTVLSGLLNPIFWALYLSGWLALGDRFRPGCSREMLLFLALFNLLAGNGAFIYLSMLAPIRRGWLDLIPYSLTVLGYWVLMSIAAYKALWQLLRNPFYWEKTQHGTSSITQARLAKASEEAGLSSALKPGADRAGPGPAWVRGVGDPSPRRACLVS